MSKPPAYAAQTDVTVAKSREEIERTLARYGADAFGYMTEPGCARVAFRIADRHIRFLLPLPRASDDEFRFVVNGARGRAPRNPDQQVKAWDQACRQRWRALCLIIKAKLEAVTAGITTVEDEFLAHTVLPDGTTFGEWAAPQISEAYRIGTMPAQLQLAGPSR